MRIISSYVFGEKALVGNKVSSQSKMVIQSDLFGPLTVDVWFLHTPVYASLLKYLFLCYMLSLLYC